MFNRLAEFREEHVTLSELLGLESVRIIEFGFSDLGIMEVAKKLGAFVLSNDFDMVSHAQSQGVQAINFTNIKTAQI